MTAELRHRGPDASAERARVAAGETSATAAVAAALDRIEQFQPVLNGRLLNRLPFVKTLGALKKPVVAARVVDRNLPPGAILQFVLPPDFSFVRHTFLTTDGHGFTRRAEVTRICTNDSPIRVAS